MFALNPRLANAAAPLTTLALCEVRIQLDTRWPWLMLVPQRPDAVELEDLSAADRALLMEEIVVAGKAVRATGDAFGKPVQKLNVGALGNRVAQLHVHIVGRWEGDPAWPEPVWGFGKAERPTEDDLRRIAAAALPALKR
jgi:diadenosine tetraphosphate (Ap4A) HIT family hydrolase